MAVAGFRCLVRRGGVPTVMSAEPMTSLGGGRYQITNPARRAIDPNSAFHLTLGAATLAYTNIAAMTFEFGEVQLSSATTGTLTATAQYVPLGSADVIADVKAFSLSETTDLLDRTVFTETTPLRRRLAGLADATVSLDMLMNDSSVPDLRDLMENEQVVLLEILSGATPRFRGWGLLSSMNVDASVDGLVEVSVEWNISAQRNAETGILAGYSDRALDS
jgi:hypothetical protein